MKGMLGLATYLVYDFAQCDLVNFLIILLLLLISTQTGCWLFKSK
jgi:hypothetical protein